MTNSIVIKEFKSAAQIKTFVKGKAFTLAKVKEELHLAVGQAVFFTAAPHNDVTALNVIFSAFAGQSKQLTSTQKKILEFVKFHTGAYLTFDQEKAEFRFKTVRVKGKSKAISEEKRTLKDRFDKMADYRDWLHPDVIAANNAANSVIDADSLAVEPIAGGENGTQDVPKEGAGKGKAIKPLTSARMESFKKAAIVTLKNTRTKDEDKKAKADLLQLIAFLAKEAGIIAPAQKGKRVTSEEAELTGPESATEKAKKASNA